MEFWQITFKNGKTLEFATKSIAEGYATMFDLAAPAPVEIDVPGVVL